MKASIYFVLAVFLFASISACKKNSNAPADNGTGTTTPKKKYLTQVITVSNGTTTFTNYTYDSQKRVVGVKLGSTITTYTYNGNDLITRDISYTSGTSVTDVVTQYTYSNGQLTQAVPYNVVDGVKKEGNSMGFVFVNGRITEKHVDTGDIIFNTYADNGDLLKVQYTGYATTYTYSDKKNLVLPDTFVAPDGYVSPHLALSETQPYPYGPGTITSTYIFDANGNVTQADTEAKGATYLNATNKYAYDSDGRMTALSHEVPNMPTSNYKTTYVYTEL